MKKVAIIGLGLIGGSLALALRKQGKLVLATDADREQVALAQRTGMDARDNLSASIAEEAPDVVVICTPISAIAAVYREYRRQLAGGDTVFLHAGGLQTAEPLGLSDSEWQGVIGTHPLAGSQHAGFHAARENLFERCVVIVERKASPSQLQIVMDIWSAAGAGKIVVEEAQLHDSRMPVVSHLPQLASTLLALTIRERGFRATDLGTGGRDATRLAGSPFGMWVELLQRSREDSVSLLARLQSNVGRMREAIAADDWRRVEEMWNEGSALYDDRPEPRNEA